MSVLGQLTPMIPAGSDFQAALDFYVEKLGFTAGYRDEGMVILKRDVTEIMLLNNDDPHTASQTSFRIQTTGVDALYAEYKAQDIAPFHLGEGAGLGDLKATPWRTREFAVRDLAGVCITFYERL
jgi:catechol 2,3-dioxygenase-like lactoylglutathione lyase family enzyme